MPRPCGRTSRDHWLIAGPAHDDRKPFSGVKLAAGAATPGLAAGPATAGLAGAPVTAELAAGPATAGPAPPGGAARAAPAPPPGAGNRGRARKLAGPATHPPRKNGPERGGGG